MQRQPRRWHDDDDATGEEEVKSASLPVTATKAAPTMAPRPQRQPVGSARNRWQPPNSTRSMPSSQSVQAVSVVSDRSHSNDCRGRKSWRRKSPMGRRRRKLRTRRPLPREPHRNNSSPAV